MKKFPLLSLLFLPLSPVFPQDTIPPSHLTIMGSIDPNTAKVGTTACIVLYTPTVEKHIWGSPTSFRDSSNCPNGSSKAVKEKDGWRIYVNRPLSIHDASTDDRYKRSGWIQFKHIEIAK